MDRMFNIPPQSSLQHVFVNEIAVSSLLEAVMAIDNTEAYWLRMLAFCVYAQFLLVSPSGNCDYKMLNVLDQEEVGLNPFPLILAEKIVGLDNFSETRNFSRSLMLLEVSFFHLTLYFCPASIFLICYPIQAWFHEKLRLLEPPQDIGRYRAKHCRTR